MSLIIKNGLLVLENGTMKADLKAEYGKIAGIGESIEAEAGDEIFDASEKIIMPGVIDAHVHYHMKTASGRTADNFETGSMAAAFGGVTSFIDYASPVEGKTMLEALQEREKEARGHSYLDYSFHMEVTNEFPQDFGQLEELVQYGITSLKIYTTYGSTQLPYERIPALLQRAKAAGMLLTVHAEDDEIVTALKKRFVNEGKTAPAYHGDSRPHLAETTAVERLLGMAGEIGATVHFVHISTGMGAELIRKARQSGLAAFGETCPHYLLLTDECYKGTEAQKFIMTPPLRKKEDNEMLWSGITDGTLQCITTDHCAFNIRDKMAAQSCFDVIPGIGGSETLLPLMFSEGYSKGRLSLRELSKLLSTNPAKLFGLYPQKGSISVGSDADLVVVNPGKKMILQGKNLHSAAEYTVFEDFEVIGWPEATIAGGRVLCRENKWMAPVVPEGRFIKGTLRHVNFI